ncbi:MAG: hypothetical protein WCD82_03015 [Xanthobacteraceae bacterium]
MRIALIVSIIAHVLFVTFSARDLRPTSHGETMTVDLVPANEAPAASAAPKSDPSAAQSKEAKPEPKVGQPSTTQAAKAESMPSEAKAPAAKPPEAKAAQAKPAPTAAMTKPAEQKPPQQQPPPPQQPPTEQKPPQPTQTATQPPAPDPQQTAPREMPPDPNRLAQMLGLPFSGNFESGERDVDSGGEREPMVKFTEGVKELKAQVRRCFKLPAGVAANQRVRTVVRIRLRQDGALASDPEPWEYAASEFGPAMMQSVMRALRQCAPYSLPADKYKEWRVLDIDFSPDQMTGS